MSAVMHGRRKGLERASPSMQLDHANSAGVSKTQDLRQVTVLGKADWERIQYQLNRRHIEAEERRRCQEERQKLHALSKERVKNWSNTLMGQRQKKLAARRLREEKEEEERQQIDVEEAKYQADKRKEAIERAKTQQYYQTDRVKGFHGALLLTEVLKEREAQLELKDLRKAASAGKDREWLEKAQREYEEGILQDHDRARERIRKVGENADFQKAQIRQHRKEYANEIEEEKIEGESLQRLAAQHQEERRKLDIIKKAEAEQLMADNLRQIDETHHMKEIHKLQDEEEDEECRIFATAKRKMLALRSEKERQLRKEKQDSLEKIREKLYIQKKQQNDDEDERIKCAMEENEAKKAKEDAEKEKRRMREHKQMADHRATQMLEIEQEKTEQRKKDLETLAVKKQADALFARNEEEKRKGKFDNSRHLMNFHLSQVKERKTLEETQREQQLAMDKKNVELVHEEETQFQEYASRVIDHCDKGGRNTIPLRKAAQEGAGGGLGPVFPGKGGVRPSYMVADQTGVQMPNYQRSTTDETKRNINGDGVTSKRLGFVWSK